jgi:hypothetical protein
VSRCGKAAWFQHCWSRSQSCRISWGSLAANLTDIRSPWTECPRDFAGLLEVTPWRILPILDFYST